MSKKPKLQAAGACVLRAGTDGEPDSCADPGAEPEPVAHPHRRADAGTNG